MTIVQCRCCHRDERWSAGPDGKPSIEVAIPGGERRAAIPQVDAWMTLRASRERTIGPIVAVCAGCGQPMSASDGAFPALPSWTIRARDGDLIVGAEITGPQGIVDAPTAEQWLLAQYRASLVPSRTDVIGALMVLPLSSAVGCWTLAVLFVIMFLATGFQSDPWVAVKLVFGAVAAFVLLGAFVGRFGRGR